MTLAMIAMPAWSSDSNSVASQDMTSAFNADPLGLITSPRAVEDPTPMPLIPGATTTGFDFDLGDSETRKLHLMIDSPISPDAIGLGLDSHTLSIPGRNVLGLDATLDMPLNPSLSLTGNVRRQQEQAQFKSLGNIQCTEGILRPDSYTASGCRFVDESFTGLDQSILNIGAQYKTPRTSTSISWFTRQSGMNTPGTSSVSSFQPAYTSGVDLLTPVMNNPLLPAAPLRKPLSYYDGQASGIDLSFQLGLATDSYGDVRFGLAFSRVLDATFNGMYSNLSPVNWNIADDYDTASMDVEWSKGSFSGGIQGFYREQVDFLSRQSLNSLSTFDVHFTWRTPWNANLSVGASNILNSGSDEANPSDVQSTDPFESIYGRIPYVRYKQDL
ncbi:MAG TPA: hypothetical protein VJ984_10025 [Xanthomonadales bacterium]|nr:hypothetical protein [Xanthomonadales bacterium]